MWQHCKGKLASVTMTVNTPAALIWMVDMPSAQPDASTVKSAERTVRILEALAASPTD